MLCFLLNAQSHGKDINDTIEDSIESLFGDQPIILLWRWFLWALTLSSFNEIPTVFSSVASFRGSNQIPGGGRGSRE